MAKHILVTIWDLLFFYHFLLFSKDIKTLALFSRVGTTTWWWTWGTPGWTAGLWCPPSGRQLSSAVCTSTRWRWRARGMTLRLRASKAICWWTKGHGETWVGSDLYPSHITPSYKVHANVPLPPSSGSWRTENLIRSGVSCWPTISSRPSSVSGCSWRVGASTWPESTTGSVNPWTTRTVRLAGGLSTSPGGISSPRQDHSRPTFIPDWSTLWHEAPVHIRSFTAWEPPLCHNNTAKSLWHKISEYSVYESVEWTILLDTWCTLYSYHCTVVP